MTLKTEDCELLKKYLGKLFATRLIESTFLDTMIELSEKSQKGQNEIPILSTTVDIATPTTQKISFSGTYHTSNNSIAQILTRTKYVDPATHKSKYIYVGMVMTATVNSYITLWDDMGKHFYGTTGLDLVEAIRERN